jgi:hypothetical protein
MLRRLQRDETGTITIEFLLWVPLLCFWFVVSVAFFDAYKSRSEAEKAAQTVSDIMSRQVEVTDAFVGELYSLQGNLLPRARAGSRLRVSSLQYSIDEEGNGAYRVIWSVPRGGGLPLADENIPIALLPEAMADLETVVLTELSVPYQPFTSWARIDITSWTYSLISRPRFVSAVAMLN